MSQVTIRAGVPADLPLIATLIRELADYEKLSHAVEMEEAVLERFLFGDRPYAETLIAEWEGEPAGFALYFHNFSTFLGRPGVYLEDLFVRPAHRARGIGKALLARLAQLAVERGCGRVEWSVLKWNQPAIGFYERLGAHPNSDWTVYRLTGDALQSLATL
ncbi:MAG TPA: GNAT family N-acetyltransferase [Candidatus Dormibacteraeota bacterium]